MKTRKTRTDARGTFTYKFADGTSVVLIPGVDGVTEADIAMLHRMDDNEVYNNVKHSKSPIQDWERESVERWKEAHPDEDAPTRTTLSLDYCADDDSQGGDKGKDALLNLICSDEEEISETEIVNAFAEEYLTDFQMMVYERVMVGDETEVELAAELGVTKQAIHYHVTSIKKIFREKYKNFARLFYFS